MLTTLCSTFCFRYLLPVALFLPFLLLRAFNAIMFFFDGLHRRRVAKHHSEWPYETVPHVRATLKQELPNSEKVKWKLLCDEGRQRWVYDPKRTSSSPRFLEKYSMGIVATDNNNSAEAPPRKDAESALLDGVSFLTKLQDETSGHWPNDYSGPLFLTCGPIFAKYVIFGGDIDKCWTKPERSELIRYLVNIQLPDGGFGMHTEGTSTMFGTVLNYVSLRLLGCDAKTDPACAAARKWIKDNGGAQTVPSWGKAWLCALGLYEWAGVNAVTAEMWLIPEWCPISMGKIWCHSRVVTLAFSYLYSRRYKCADTPLLAQLRTELYSVVPYEQVQWAECRCNVQGQDLYYPLSGVYHVINSVLLFYEHRLLSSWLFGGVARYLRNLALRTCVEHMKFDDTSTNFICLGPVNKALNMLITWIEEGPDSTDLQKHLERLPDYFWIGADGMRMSGYNGSQLWDTSFALQAMFASPEKIITQFKKEIANGHHYIDVAQVREDPENSTAFYRSRAKGAWNFSTRAQSWQVSDCTAEGLRIALLARRHPTISKLVEPLEDQRIFDAVDTILYLRDTRGVTGTGGWASYEEPRGPTWFELLNCAEVYKDVMVDYIYAECTSSCVHSLVIFQQQFPTYRKTHVDRAIADGVRVIKALQRPDGSWYGSWGVCFTYAAWLATEALRLAGETSEESVVFKKACKFLLSKQRDDGGWGEDFNACVTQEWRENPDGSQVVNTAWACMALIAAGGKRHFAAVERGIKLIMSRQLRSGDWKQERISGVFNGNCAIHYPAYKNNMTVWALAKFVELKKSM